MKNFLSKTLAASVLLLASQSGFTGESPLSAALDAQPDDVKARYEYRNPKETLKFFGIKPGMTVVEALPGGGWYSKILLPVLGKDGTLVGVDYAQSMWPKFGFMSEERIEKRKDWVATWTADAEEWRGDNSANVKAFKFGSMPDTMQGKADAVLFIRAMHNLARFESDGGYMTQALKDTFDVLKPGGVVGIVQHQAREDRPDEWANGSNGYVKKSFVVAQMEKAGFELVGESPINENEKDLPGDGDFVWRLPPTLNGVGDDEEKKAAMQAIGESHRMTLLFRKPK